MVNLKWRMRMRRGRTSCSRSGAHEVAAGLDGRAAFAAKRAIFGLVARDGEIEQSLTLHGKLDFAAAAVDERSGTHDAAPGFFNNLDGFKGRAAGGPNVFNNENMLIGQQIETATQGHRAAGIALDKNSG